MNEAAKSDQFWDPISGAWFWSLSGLGIGSGDTQLEPVSGAFGVHIWTRTPVWPLELIFSGIISVCHSS